MNRRLLSLRKPSNSWFWTRELATIKSMVGKLRVSRAHLLSSRNHKSTICQSKRKYVHARLKANVSIAKTAVEAEAWVAGSPRLSFRKKRRKIGCKLPRPSRQYTGSKWITITTVVIVALNLYHRAHVRRLLQALVVLAVTFQWPLLQISHISIMPLMIRRDWRVLQKIRRGYHSRGRVYLNRVV